MGFGELLHRNTGHRMRRGSRQEAVWRRRGVSPAPWRRGRRSRSVRPGTVRRPGSGRPRPVSCRWPCEVAGDVGVQVGTRPRLAFGVTSSGFAVVCFGSMSCQRRPVLIVRPPCPSRRGTRCSGLRSLGWPRRSRGTTVRPVSGCKEDRAIWSSGSDRNGGPGAQVGRTPPCGLLPDPPTGGRLAVVAVVVPMSLCAPAGTHLRRIFCFPGSPSGWGHYGDAWLAGCGLRNCLRKGRIWPPVP